MPIRPLITETTRTTEAIVRVLEEAGIDMVFGMAGGHTGRLFKALSRHQDTIRTVLVREESLASVMAEIYGRTLGKPGVIIGQGAWVLGNGIIGTLEAMLSSSPMLLLTDFSDTPGFDLHGAYQSGTGDYGGWNARQAYAGITKQVFEARDPVTAVQATQLAIKHALSGQPGPVAVLFGEKALAGNVEPDTRPRLYSTGPYLPPPPPDADQRRVEDAARILADAKRPIIIAGNGVRVGRAFASLQRIAEHAGCPVVTTPSGKGVLAENHPLALGVFGTFGTPAANAAVAESDVVLVVGSKLGAFDTARENLSLLDPVRQAFIQVDVETRNASWTFPTEQVLIGDAGTVVDQLIDALGSHASRRAEGEARVAGLRAEHGYFDPPEAASDSVPIHPLRAISELCRNLPDDAIVTCDAGENRIMMTHFFQTRNADGFLQAAGAGPMGFAIPAALGAKLLHPDRTVVAVCGDGGFAMTMNGLMSALECKIPIVVFVLNNHALGWVFHAGGPFAAEFDKFDHAAIARSMGCEGISVTNPAELAQAIVQAVASTKPTVIDVMTSLDYSYQAVTSPLLA